MIACQKRRWKHDRLAAAKLSRPARRSILTAPATPAFRPFTEADALAAAARALSRAAGRPVQVGPGERLSEAHRRNLVVRAATDDGRRIIVKATRSVGYDPAADDAYELPGFAREWAALSLLGARGVAGGLLAADAGHGVLVLEDAGLGLDSLVTPLLRGSAVEAEAALRAYAVALAGLHAATLDCRAQHTAMVQQAFPAARIPAGTAWVDRVARPVAKMLPGALPEAEVAQVAERLRAPGPWLALVHRDPCPDNVLLAADGKARLIDFEFATPGHALLDASYWRVGFPTCWCAGTVPEAVADRLDAAYRAALGSPVDDGAFERESAVATAAWLFDALSWQLKPALEADARWGIAGRRARVLHYLAVAAERLDGWFPQLQALAALWRDSLRAQWAPVTPLAPYPAFA